MHLHQLIRIQFAPVKTVELLQLIEKLDLVDQIVFLFAFLPASVILIPFGNCIAAFSGFCFSPLVVPLAFFLSALIEISVPNLFVAVLNLSLLRLEIEIGFPCSSLVCRSQVLRASEIG